MGIRTAAQRAHRRHVLRGRRTLWAALASPSGVIDVASVIVGVIILAVLGTITAAALITAVPWAQESEARTTLNNVRLAENASRIATGQYQSVANLIGGGYLTKSKYSAAPDPYSGALTNTGLPNPGVPLTTVGPGTFGTCYVAALRLNTGMVLWLSSSNTSIAKINPADGAPDVSSCGAFPYVANFPIPPLKITYPQQSFSISNPQPLSPTRSGGTGAALTYSYTGTLPAGVAFNSATGVFTSAAFSTSATQIDVGGANMGCAVGADTSVKCWGRAVGFGDLGNGQVSGTWNTPQAVLSGSATGAPLIGVKKVAVGGEFQPGYFGCALMNDTTINCWGYNTYGQLGDASVASYRTFAAPVLVGGNGAPLTGAVDISVGYQHVCALMSDQTAKCWGYQSGGRLGNNVNTGSKIYAPTTVLASVGVNLTGISKIDAGETYTCAVASGAAKCWGDNTNYQLGDNTTIAKAIANQVPGLTSGVIDISAGYQTVCALLANHSLTCWGQNSTGVFDTGGTTVKTPVAIGELAGDVESVSVGVYNICAITLEHEARCWGKGGDGHFGNGDIGSANSSAPQTVTLPGGAAVTGASQIRSSYVSECAVANGTAYCWGQNSQGNLGNGTTGTATTGQSFTASQVSGYPGATGFGTPLTVTATPNDGSPSYTVPVSLGVY